jgi:hypothetical protein
MQQGAGRATCRPKLIAREAAQPWLQLRAMQRIALHCTCAPDCMCEERDPHRPARPALKAFAKGLMEYGMMAGTKAMPAPAPAAAEASSAAPEPVAAGSRS